jgi:hypothetical protein
MDHALFIGEKDKHLLDDEFKNGDKTDEGEEKEKEGEEEEEGRRKEEQRLRNILLKQKNKRN